jgi:hypothetical protein
MRSFFALVSLVAAGSLAIAACSGDDDSGGPTVGAGGTAGKGDAGKSGKGGGAGKGLAGESSGGEAGAAGTGGTESGVRGGRGGTGSGASGGNGGSSGKGGSTEFGGAPSAGSGDTSASGGMAGASGEHGGAEAGASGQGSSPEQAKFCTYRCTSPDQCGTGNTCSDAGRCVPISGAPSCNVNDDCTPSASSWSEQCMSDGDCFGTGYVCVGLGAAGWCAQVAAPDCFSGAPSVFTRFGSTDQVSVCSIPGVCQRHQCVTSCAVDADCPIGGPHCQTSTHLCLGCTSDGECTSAGVSHCDIPSGTCQCAFDSDCTGAAPGTGIPGTDQCVNGTCGCSSASICTENPDSTIACE